MINGKYIALFVDYLYVFIIIPLQFYTKFSPKQASVSVRFKRNYTGVKHSTEINSDSANYKAGRRTKTIGTRRIPASDWSRPTCRSFAAVNVTLPH